MDISPGNRVNVLLDLFLSSQILCHIKSIFGDNHRKYANYKHKIILFTRLKLLKFSSSSKKVHELLTEQLMKGR